MNDLREQFIERLTRELFGRRGSGFVLKGGGAMRALFGSQRLTRDVDLDFVNPKRTADSLHRMVTGAIQRAARGLAALQDLQVSEPGKREASPRWKVNFRDARGRRYHVEVEVSRDASRAPPGAVVQQAYTPEAVKGIPRFWVDIYAGPVLIATKLAALLGREVPRDVYDLDLLIEQVDAPDDKLVSWAVTRAGVSGDPVAVLWDRLEALNWERFQSELLDALPEPVAERVDATEWTAMKLRVGEYVEALLRRLGECRS
jgi:predicted nucleotidyltransferase component of viral defense system